MIWKRRTNKHLAQWSDFSLTSLELLNNVWVKDSLFPQRAKLQKKFVLLHHHPQSTSQMLVLGTFTNPHWKIWTPHCPMKIIRLSTWVTFGLVCSFKVNPEVSLSAGSTKINSARGKHVDNNQWNCFNENFTWHYWRITTKKNHTGTQCRAYFTAQMSFHPFAQWTLVEL